MTAVDPESAASRLGRGAEVPAASVATWFGFAMMCLGLFMAILDMQIVATSLPTIRAALGIKPEAMSWIQTAYIIAEVITIPITGYLTRVWSMRGLFVIGVTVFTLASIGCASSSGFTTLIAWRIMQGFAAGTLIPAVFSAVFLLFPPRVEVLATSIAGMIALLAPTVGPIVGGVITHAFSWRWLFLVNVAPGVLAAVVGGLCLPRDKARPGLIWRLDGVGCVWLALALASLVIGLKQAPDMGWVSPVVLALFALSALTSWLFFRRALHHPNPVAAVRVLADPRVAVGCLLNFGLGFGFFGATYLMPVFLGLVREHDALEIGRIMLVTGLAQLAAAPFVVVLEKRLDARILAAFGFALFAVGLAMSGFQTVQTDYHQMFWAQIVRGVAIMFCVVPPTRIALGHLALAEIPNASGLFNVARNLGGAIGLALIDTVIYGRAPIWAERIKDKLLAGDIPTAKAVGIPIDAFVAARGQPIDDDTRELIAPLVQKLALADAINEAWLVLAAITLLAMASLIWLALVRAKPVVEQPTPDIPSQVQA
jgi:DHA2 family multidrug resistance protein